MHRAHATYAKPRLQRPALRYARHAPHVPYAKQCFWRRITYGAHFAQRTQHKRAQGTQCAQCMQQAASHAQKMFRTNFRNYPQNVLQVYGHGPNKNVDKFSIFPKKYFYIIFFRATTKRWTFCLPSLRGKIASLGVRLSYQLGRLHKTFFFILPK